MISWQPRRAFLSTVQPMHHSKKRCPVPVFQMPNRSWTPPHKSNSNKKIFFTDSFKSKRWRKTFGMDWQQETNIARCAPRHTLYDALVHCHWSHKTGAWSMPSFGVALIPIVPLIICLWPTNPRRRKNTVNPSIQRFSKNTEQQLKATARLKVNESSHLFWSCLVSFHLLWLLLSVWPPSRRQVNRIEWVQLQFLQLLMQRSGMWSFPEPQLPIQQTALRHKHRTQ